MGAPSLTTIAITAGRDNAPWIAWARGQVERLDAIPVADRRYPIAHEQVVSLLAHIKRLQSAASSGASDQLER